MRRILTSLTSFDKNFLNIGKDYQKGHFLLICFVDIDKVFLNEYIKNQFINVITVFL